MAIREDQQVTVYYEILISIKISLYTVRCWEPQVKNILTLTFYLLNKQINLSKRYPLSCGPGALSG